MCCCTSLHRHQIHLISYGCVSFGLITTGLVFTVFAIFQKDSQIGKVWLAGPTTMVVGLVLCGKVIIDWGPAMLHAREGSMDSRLNEHFQSVPMKSPPPQLEIPMNSTYYPMQKRNGGMPNDAVDCIIYSQYDTPRNSLIKSGATTMERQSGLESVHPSTHTSSSATIVSPDHSVADTCECKYGSLRRPTRTIYQGESFVLNERSFLI